MISKLIFFMRKHKYNKFHKKYKFSQLEVNEIVQKVKLNQPDLIESLPSLEILKKSGIKIDLPIYVEMAKNINFCYAKNLYLASLITSFNLIIFFEKLDEIKSLKLYLKNAKFLDFLTVEVKLKQSIFLLNINRQNSLNYSLKSQDEIAVKNYQVLTKSFKNFAMQYCLKFDKNLMMIEEVNYNGKFYFFNNINKNNKKIIILIKKTLNFNNFNYFLIKNIKNGVKIINIFNNQIYYVLTNLLIKEFNLTKIKGTNNFQISAKFAQTNLQETANYFVYFGKIFITNFDEISRQNLLKKTTQKFNFKIKSGSAKIDFMINKYLPEQIVKNEFEKVEQIRKINLKSVEQFLYFFKVKKLSASECYFGIKNLLFQVKNDFIYFGKCEISEYKLIVEVGGESKTFFVMSGKTKSVVVENFEYKNCNCFSFSVVKKYHTFNVNV